MTEVIDFNSEVLNFVTENYGSKMLEKVTSKKNKETVNKILTDSKNNSYDIQKTANKIIAMLRINP